MSRLDSFIRRLQAQRACIDFVARDVERLSGPVLELGLGNGRTFDHLRERMRQRTIYVFDRQVLAHPDCVPEPVFLRLGEFGTTLPAFAAEGHPGAVFIHADTGSGQKADSVVRASDLTPVMVQLLGAGGYLASDQPVQHPALQAVPLPEDVAEGRYFLFRKAR